LYPLDEFPCSKYIMNAFASRVLLWTLQAELATLPQIPRGI